jgi:hypothetical protein
VHVSPGALVTTTGWPLLTPDGPGLVLRREGAQYEPVQTLDLPWTVRTSMPAPVPLRGELVDARGRWDGHQIVLDDVFAARPMPSPLPAPIDSTTPGVTSRVRAAVDRLIEADVLAAWRVDNLPSRRIAVCVFDDHPAVAELLDVGGVEVTRCRWTRETVRAARALHERVPDELLSSFGENTRPDGQPEVTLEVKYVTGELSASIANLGGLVSASGLLRPAEHA